MKQMAKDPDIKPKLREKLLKRIESIKLCATNFILYATVFTMCKPTQNNGTVRILPIVVSEMEVFDNAIYGTSCLKPPRKLL